MAVLFGRQFDDGSEFIDEDDSEVPWWATRTAQIVKWSLFLAFFLILVLYMSIGYWHAKRRIQRGLPPLKYHRWLLNRRTRAQYDPSFRDPVPVYTTYQPGYTMHVYPPPPPQYDPNLPPPPTYQPAGAVKVETSNWTSEPTRRPETSGERAPEYQPPPGPPPSAPAAAPVQTQNTGASTTSNNPYRL